MLRRVFEKRLRGHPANGYALGEAPLGGGEAADELAVEWDLEAARPAGHADRGGFVVEKRVGRTALRRSSKAWLEALIEQATVDCYNEEEEATGFFTMIEGNLELPFKTNILGMQAAVERIDLTERGEVVAVCRRGREKQRFPLLSLQLPAPPPSGYEWIEAYRQWRRRSRMINGG